MNLKVVRSFPGCLKGTTKEDKYAGRIIRFVIIHAYISRFFREN